MICITHVEELVLLTFKSRELNQVNEAKRISKNQKSEVVGSLLVEEIKAGDPTQLLVLLEPSRSCALLAWSWHLGYVQVCLTECLLEYLSLTKLAINIEHLILPVVIPETELEYQAIVERHKTKYIFVSFCLRDGIVYVAYFEPRCI